MDGQTQENGWDYYADEDGAVMKTRFAEDGPGEETYRLVFFPSPEGGMWQWRKVDR